MKGRVWITWENQRRNTSLSTKLNAKLYVFDINAPSFIRYPVAISKTIAALIKERPDVIFSQNPSLILALLMTILSRAFHTTLVIDAHNAGLFPLEGKYAFLNWIASKICKWADLTIVSNIELEKYVSSVGGKAISIPDPIPYIQRPNIIPDLNGEYNVLFICSWSNDEPFLEVIEAARLVGSHVSIYITGNSKEFENKHRQELPNNIILTGYVSENVFAGLLYACNSVMALTYRENCLLCGAYEGEAVEKPIILSSTNAIKRHFRKGCVYTENNAKSISDAINTARQNNASLRREIKYLKKEHNAELTEIVKTFESHIAQ